VAKRVILLKYPREHMNNYKTYKLRIYPTDSQKELIEKNLSCVLI